MSLLKRLDDLPVTDKRVLVRVDFNVPLTQKGGEWLVEDDFRITSALPTLNDLLNRGAKKLVLISHLGQPKRVDPSLSLAPVARHLEHLLGERVYFAKDCIDDEAAQALANPSRVVVMENLRFHHQEQQGDQEGFARSLAPLGELFVFDAFGAAHRSDSSCVALPRLFPGKRAAGRLVWQELDALNGHLKDPVLPFVSILGGAKMSSKLLLISKLLNRCSRLIVVGALAHTFLVAQGTFLGASMYEPQLVERAREILEEARALGKALILPVDGWIQQSDQSLHLVDWTRPLPEDARVLDIGPKSIEQIRHALQGAGTIFWNGPAGAYEDPHFQEGSAAIAKMLAESSAVTVVGGGDSAAVVRALRLSAKLTYLSSGGGATIEWMEQGDLPAIAALRE